MPLQTPVALLIFNRPDVTRRVCEAIARQRPQRLLIVADGSQAAREWAWRLARPLLPIALRRFLLRCWKWRRRGA